MKLISLLTAGILCFFAGTANAICPHACNKNGSVSLLLPTTSTIVCLLVVDSSHIGPSSFFVAVRCVSQDLFFMCSLRWCSCCSPPSICCQARTINALAISGQMVIQVSPLVCLCCRCLFRPSSLTSSSSSVCVLFFAPQPGLAPIVPAERAPREQHGPPLQK